MRDINNAPSLLRNRALGEPQLSSLFRHASIKKDSYGIIFILGWGWGIRTPEWWDQNPLPYHLANPQRSMWFYYILYKKAKCPGRRSVRGTSSEAEIRSRKRGGGSRSRCQNPRRHQHDSESNRQHRGLHHRGRQNSLHRHPPYRWCGLTGKLPGSTYHHR